MLQSCPIGDINWEVVESFCQSGYPEGTTIDYKADWPADLGKTIAAMANTLGGLVLIGVETDDHEVPKTPISGIQGTDRLELRVFDICEGSIFPPVIPEVRVCPNSDGSRCTVVIRVPISRQAHAVDRNTRVYVRTGNRNSHNELADVSKIEWLLGLRGNLERQRYELVEKARGRYTPMLQSVIARSGTAVSSLFFQRHWIEMYAVPTFPSRQLVADGASLQRLARDVVQHNEPGYGAMFPPSLASGRGRHVFGGHGIASFTAGTPNYGCYHEVNEHGLFYMCERVGHEHPQMPTVSILGANFLAEHIHSFLFSALRLYDDLGYRGPIELHFQLVGVEGQTDLRYVPLNVSLAMAGERCWSPDSVLTVQKSTSTLDLSDTMVEIVVDVAGRFDMAFGSTTNDEARREFVQARHRALTGS